MKRLLLMIALFISSTLFAAPWGINTGPKTLPTVTYVSSFVWDAAYTPSGLDELVVISELDAPTGAYWSRVTVSVYGNYRKTQLGWPQVYYQWGYKEFTVDIPPNTQYYQQSHYIHPTDSFNMSGVGTANGQGEALASGQTTLVGFVEM